ncbi:MAG: hypothetical protein WCF90_04740 [Methanomicrobiales archaeon]
MLNVEISLIRLDLKESKLILAIVRDVSEHRPVKYDRQESARLMTNIIGFLSDAPFVIDTDGGSLHGTGQ